MERLTEDYNHYSIQRVTRKKTEVAAIGSIKIKTQPEVPAVPEVIEACKDKDEKDIEKKNGILQNLETLIENV